MDSKNRKVGLGEKLIYGSGDMGLNMMYTLFSSYVLMFYTDVIGLNPALIGTCILVSKVLDGISDLIAGQWIDTHKGKKGHCIPILARWSIPMLLSVVFVFMVPNTSLALRLVFIMVTYNLFNTVTYTVVGAAHATLASYVTDDSTTRSQMMIYKMMFAALTQTFMASSILPVVNACGGRDSQMAWVKAVLIFGVIGLVTLLLNAYFVKERVDNPQPPENVFKGVGVALRNKYWLLTVIIGIFTNIILMFNLSVAVFYLKDVMQNEALMGAWVAVSNIPGIFVALVIPGMLSKGVSKRNLSLIGIGIMLVGQILFIMLPGSPMTLLITGLIKGIGFGFPMGMGNAMVADTMDYGEWKTGVRVQGVLMAATGVGSKLGQGLLTSLFGIFLTAVGYDGMLKAQAVSTVQGIDTFFQWGPIAVLVVLFVLTWFYKVEAMNPKIRQELVARRGEI